jgi:hypothetical protein
MEETQEIKLSRHQRYHALNREKRISYQLERYYNNPEVIAKREERERKKAEREAEKAIKKAAEKEAKQQEKKRKQDERTALALATKKVHKETLESILDPR